MTPDEIFSESCVPDTHETVFVLGSFEKRVTVYSQQVRALNLVDAILAKGLRANARVAIVGGGVAGMTAAVAFAKAAPRLAQLDLFERRARVLELQHGSRRYLHPHFYEWPAADSDAIDAGLPIMNWQAGSAGDVTNVLRSEFDRTIQSSVLKQHLSVSVVAVNPSRFGHVRVVTADGVATSKIFDVVILAIGFGLERCIEGETPSYWTPSGLAGAILSTTPNPIIFISGNGDGGLVDFQMAAFNALEHSAICELIARLDLGRARAILETIEREAWADGADLDLLEEYRNRVLAHVPPGAWAEIRDNLRPNIRIFLHTNEAKLLRKTTALHNRLATFLLIELDREIGANAITLKVGVNFDGPPPSVGEIKLQGEAPFHPFRRYLRIGPDSASNLAPFHALLDRLASTRAAQARPVTPILSASASERFEPFRAARIPPMVAAPAPIANAQQILSVSVTLSVNENVIWAGDFGPANVSNLWAEGIKVELYCDIKAADAGNLMTAFARLGAQAENLTLYARDAAGWQAVTTGLCAEYSFPNPDLGCKCSIKEWREPPHDLPTVVEHSLDDIVTIIHDRLDADLLERLHTSIFEVLGPREAATGWPIEATLRRTLWELWQQWHNSLRANLVSRRRFLRLLASVEDHINVEDSFLVRLGPKILRPHLTKPTLFGLAFSACSGRAMVPVGSHPGNMALDGLTGHACGVGWIDKRELRGRTAASQAWTTNVVLLSQLQEVVRLLEADVRFDRNPTDVARLGLTSIADMPIIIGADDDFLMALQSGTLATKKYFQDIFDQRAILSQKSLEEA